MIKIYLSEKNLGKWSLASDQEHVKHFLMNIGYTFTENIFRANIIFSVWCDALLNNRKYFTIKLLRKLTRVKVVTTISNEEIIYSKDLDKLKEVVDLWIVPNKRVQNFLKPYGFKMELIPFYVNRAIFKRMDITKKDICDFLQIDYGTISNKFLIGSFQRDSLGSDLTKPKWHKNPDLLIKLLNDLPRDRFILILAGPRRHYIIDQCKKYAIPYLFYGNSKYINESKDDLVENNLSSESIAFLYNLVDLYIVSSKSEGGPKAILEASLTKTLIISTAVGLAPDILHEDLIYDENNYKQTVSFINNIIENNINITDYANYNYQNTSKALDETILLEKYKSVIKNA